MKRFAPGERRHPTIGSDWSLFRAEHRDNVVLARWTVRELGITVIGPDLSTLIDLISAEDLRAAVVGECRARMKD